MQFPGPTLIVNAGRDGHRHADQQPADAHVDRLPGAERRHLHVAACVSSPTAAAAEVNPGNAVTYSFVASNPGTYTYHSGTQMDVQVEMGLVGALIVRPAGLPSRAYAPVETAFTPEREYLLMLSEIDPVRHQKVYDQVVAAGANRAADLARQHQQLRRLCTALLVHQRPQFARHARRRERPGLADPALQRAGADAPRRRRAAARHQHGARPAPLPPPWQQHLDGGARRAIAQAPRQHRPRPGAERLHAAHGARPDRRRDLALDRRRPELGHVSARPATCGQPKIADELHVRHPGARCCDDAARRPTSTSRCRRACRSNSS